MLFVMRLPHGAAICASFPHKRSRKPDAAREECSLSAESSSRASGTSPGLPFSFLSSSAEDTAEEISAENEISFPSSMN